MKNELRKEQYGLDMGYELWVMGYSYLITHNP